MTNELTRVNQLPEAVLTFDDVFSYPEYTLRGVKTWEDVAKLGRRNIGALISSARSNEKSMTEQIGKLKEMQKLLRGKSGDDFKEMAEDFENPVITEIGVPSDSWSDDPEPLDAESKKRKHDATTFNLCGWCKHSAGGTGRYQFMITTSCRLLRDGSPETRFNTPCLLQAKTAEEIEEIVEGIESEIEELLRRRELVRKGITLLQKLKKDAPDKPYLMSLRPHDHFNVGDDIMVYVGQWGDEGEHKLTVAKSLTDPNDSVWVPAIVVLGYRHHDGCVSYQTLFPIHSNMSYYEGRGGGAGMSRPEALLRSEFNYLQEAAESDMDFLGLWIANIDDHLRGFDRITFLRDISNGKIATPPADWQPPADEISVRSAKEAGQVLQMLDPDLFKTEREIRDWANMQLRHVHPDKLNGVNENVRVYAERQTKAVYTARDLLIERLRNSK